MSRKWFGRQILGRHSFPNVFVMEKTKRHGGRSGQKKIERAIRPSFFRRAKGEMVM